MDYIGSNVKVSVIIPVYNAEKYVAACLESILAQKIKDIEIICVDDGSTDKSTDICKDYAKKHSNVKVICQGNSGPANARNNGLSAATGEWIVFADSDDWMEPDMLSIMLNMVEKQGEEVDIVICSYYENHEDGRQTIGNSFLTNQLWDKGRIEIEQRKFLCKGIKEYRPYVSVGFPWGKLYRRAMLEVNEIYFPRDFYRNEDGIFNLYAFQHSRKISYINQPLYHYRISGNSISHGLFCNVVQYTEADFHEVRLFANKYKKNDVIFMKGINVRTCTWFFKYLAHYYFHREYIREHGYIVARREVLTLLNKENYRQAYKTVDFSLMNREQQIFVFFAKYRMVELLYLATIVRSIIMKLKGKN